MPKGSMWAVVAILILAAFLVGRASDRDEAVVTVVVSAAEHELEEGYFSLGESTTMVAKPGSELYAFLRRQRNHRIKMTLTEDQRPTLIRLSRGSK